jgi:hypothetical protein
MTDSAKKDLVDALAALVKERRLCTQLLPNPMSVALMKPRWRGLWNSKRR